MKIILHNNILKAMQEQLNLKRSKVTKMNSILGILEELFSKAISKAFPNIPDAPVVIALSGSSPKFGDYQCNSAMPISNIYKQLGK